MFKSLALAAILGGALACCKCGAVYAAPATVTLAVSNMYCATCPLAVKKALSRVEGVTAVEVNFDKKEATVAFDDQKATVQTLTKATADAGFPSSPKEGASK